jgi:hypothetical protein
MARASHQVLVRYFLGFVWEAEQASWAGRLLKRTPAVFCTVSGEYGKSITKLERNEKRLLRYGC